MDHAEKVSILLVDDRADGLITLEAVLKDEKYNLVLAHSGVEALRCLLEGDFAVVILDVQMPGMNGFETASLMRQREESRHVPIIFVTAINKDYRYVAEGYECGAVDYLFKPFDPLILRSKISVFAELFRKNRELKRQSDKLREQERIIELQRQLLKTTEELKRSNEELEQFAYVASHDLQEPVRTVGVYAQLLEQTCNNTLSGKAFDYLRVIREGAKRTQTLINDLLECSRIGRKEDKFEDIDLNKVLAEVIELLGPSIKETDTIIEAERLPQLFGNPVMLRQVFQNLLANAIKFRSDRSPVIRISAKLESDQCTVRVSDNGIGIEPEFSDKIFQIFQRLHTREKYPGSGIGLAICKKIIERHNGRIWVTSEKDGGCAFSFSLPTNQNAGTKRQAYFQTATAGR